MKLTRKSVTVGSVLIIILALLYLTCYPLYKYINEGREAKAAMRKAYEIHQALIAYASSNDQVFPIADHFSNEAFRQLFIKGLIKDETLFSNPISPWGKPDGKIGTPDDGFASAVGPGETFWAYVSGYASDRDDSTLPIIIDGYTAERLRGMADRRPDNMKKFCIVVRIGGQAKVMDSANSDDDLKKLLAGARILMPQPPTAK